MHFRIRVQKWSVVVYTPWATSSAVLVKGPLGRSLELDMHLAKPARKKLGVTSASLSLGKRHRDLPFNPHNAGHWWLMFGLYPGSWVRVSRKGCLRTAKKLAAALLIDPRVRESAQ